MDAFVFKKDFKYYNYLLSFLLIKNINHIINFVML